MPAVSRNAISETFFKAHPWIYRKTGGRFLGQFGASPILLLNTRGRRSGQPRCNGLVYLERGDSWAVAASWAGEPKHPAWYLNVMANPDVTIQIRDRVIDVRARELTGSERDAVWREIVQQDPSFEEYEQRTEGVRQIPVIVFEPREQEDAKNVYTLYGLSCSYFTGKLEAYMQAKGIPFEFVEMNRALFRHCARETGIAQLPCVKTPQGRWLTDTTAIMDHFETESESEPSLRPADEASAFLSLLLEDLFDEWFWRPALYYRWAFDEDARLMSSRLAKTIAEGVPLPLFLRKQLVLRRQRIVYLRKDGVTKQTAPAVEALYRDSLKALEAVFSKRPFLFGDRPCEADFGLFGPFFRHFFCDPTPGALMRQEAPHLAHWVTRLWVTRPEDVAGAAPITETPDDLKFFFDMVGQEYFPYLAANADAYARGAEVVSYEANGVAWSLPTAPYRVQCLNELKRRFRTLTPGAADRVRALLDASAVTLLEAPITSLASSSESKQLLGRLWRPAAAFD